MIRVAVNMQTVGDEEPLGLKAFLKYDTRDPYAVCLQFPHDGIEWVFARELLASGLNSESGKGDVRVWSARGTTFICLSTVTDAIVDSVMLRVDSRDVKRFLKKTTVLVPQDRESEWMNFDSELEELLS